MTAAAPLDLPIAQTQYLGFHGLPPTGLSPAGTRSWFVRAQNFALVYSEVEPGDTLDHDGAEESVLLLPDEGARVTIRAGAGETELVGAGLAIIPPGRSTALAHGRTAVVRLLAVRDGDAATWALNGAAYLHRDARVAPTPVARPSNRLRTYRLQDHPAFPGSLGAVFRSASFTINFVSPIEGPRDPERLTPHHHDDFEQCSLAVAGEWVHHIRTPWGPRRSRWVDDQHRLVGSPSATIIPPPTIHTSEAVGPGTNRLIDIFSPPRADFSAIPGLVLNADDYALDDSRG